ncbi:MAG: class I tRNA ligase family protein [Bacteroidota bacterium]
MKNIELLAKVENLRHKVGFSERNPDTVIEPKLSLQWFVDMQKIVGPALENVMNHNIEFYPSKFKNVYKHWLENIKDWPISRQLWWGQQIPAYYYGKDGVAVAKTNEEALDIAIKESGNSNLTLDDLKRDEDVVDTWFSSWLLPISVFDGFDSPDNEEFKYYYPTSILVTGWDIIFFWVARMIIAGYEFAGEMPFHKVYFTGMVRDLQGRKMSKSLGNSPDALKLIDDYGADAVRVGMLLSSAAGNDLLFDEKLCDQGKKFANKIWNAFRLVQGWEVDEDLHGDENQIAMMWFDSRFNKTLIEVEDHFNKFRISDALMATYKLIWDDFCSWYLEMVKPEYGKPIDRATLGATKGYFEKILKLLHPFMPFISEELWHELHEREEFDYLITAHWPVYNDENDRLLSQTSDIFELITNIRNTRNTQQISPKKALKLFIKSPDYEKFEDFDHVIKKLGNIESIEETVEKVENAASFVVKADEFFIPTEGGIDVEKEVEEISKELNRLKGFLVGIDKKLSNERFVNNAPEQVINTEKKKKADNEAKIKILEERLSTLQ